MMTLTLRLPELQLQARHLLKLLQLPPLLPQAKVPLVTTKQHQHHVFLTCSRRWRGRVWAACIFEHGRLR